MKKYAFVILASFLGQISFASSTVAELSKQDVKSLLTCAPSLVSKQSNTADSLGKVRTEHGNMVFERTDVNEPDGVLTVSRLGLDTKNICSLDLSLNDTIHYSSVLKMMIISGTSGSNQWYDVYSLDNDSCVQIGVTASEEATQGVTEILTGKNVTPCKF